MTDAADLSCLNCGGTERLFRCGTTDEVRCAPCQEIYGSCSKCISIEPRIDGWTAQDENRTFGLGYEREWSIDRAPDEEEQRALKQVRDDLAALWAKRFPSAKVPA